MKTRPAQLPVRPLPGLLLIVALVPAGSGCQRGGPISPDHIELLSPDQLVGAPEEAVGQLAVRVLGRRAVDFLGRETEREPAAGAAVLFRIEGEDHKKAGEGIPYPSTHPLLYLPETRPGAALPAGSDAGHIGLEVPADEAGRASVSVRLGTMTGEWSVEARAGKEKARFRVLSGVKVDVPAEGVVGTKVPVGIRLVRRRELTEGVAVTRVEEEPPEAEERWLPVPERQVIFRQVSEPPGAERFDTLQDPRNFTDRYGWHKAELTLGEAPGVYVLTADIMPPKELEPQEERPYRTLVLRIVAVDWILVVLKLATGVLIFVVGVRFLGSGLLLLTSPYMHLPTGSWARNRVQGYLGGALIGATFQSSSLVASHLVSLANGGLLTASGGLGLVCGAVLGGTVLPQILALDPSALTAPLLLAGALLLVWRRGASLSSWAWVFLGSGLILAGWQLLGVVAGQTALSESLRRGFLIGDLEPELPFLVYTLRFVAYFSLAAVVSFVLRTSNLLVVLAMLFAGHELIGAATALPVVFGANFGAAGLVFAASLRKRNEARRLALANFLLQVLGCAGVTFLTLVRVGGQPLFLWLVEALTPGHLFPLATNVEGHIASAHTLHNFLAGVAFLIFPRALLGPTDRLFPASPGAEELKPHVLDRQLIAVPALALRQATAEVVYMTEICRKTVAEAYDSFRYNDLELSGQVMRRAETIAGMHRDVSLFLVDVASNQLSHRDACQLEVLTSTADSLARIGELAERIRDLTGRKIEEGVTASDEVNRDLNEAYDLVIAQFGNVLSLLRQRDARTAESAVKVMERLAKFSSRVDTYWRQRIEQSDPATPPVAIHLQTVIYQEAFSLLFRVAGHLAQVAQRMRIFTAESF